MSLDICFLTVNNVSVYLLSWSPLFSLPPSLSRYQLHAQQSSSYRLFILVVFPFNTWSPLTFHRSTVSIVSRVSFTATCGR